MKRKKYVLVLSFAIMAMVLAGVHVNIFAGKGRVATLTSLKGSVTITLASAPAQPKAGVNNMVISEGDVVKTAGGASVVIRFDDGSMVKLGPISSMKIGKLASSGKGGNTQLDVSNGKVWTRATKQNRDSSFNVKTPTAVAGVRGTYYSSEVDSDATSRFDVFDGEVAVANLSNPAEQISVKANQTTTVQQGKSPTPAAAIPKDRLQEEKSGFGENEAAASTFDLQIDANPASIVPGGKSVLTVKVFRNGQLLRKELPMRLKLGGSAIFVSNGLAEIDISTGPDGVASLEVTAPSEQAVTVDVSLRLQVKKKK